MLGLSDCPINDFIKWPPFLHWVAIWISADRALDEITTLIGEIGTWSVKLSNAKLRSIERDFPHIVETAVPEGDPSKMLDTMYAFHKRHGIAPRIGQGWLDQTGHHHIRWCFSVPTIATFFKNEFGVR